MLRLLPERQAPRELAILDHAFVAAPRRVHEDIEHRHLCKRCGDLRIVGVIADDAMHRRWEIGHGHRATRGEDVVAGVGERDGDSATNSAACSSNQCSGHRRIVAGGDQ